MQYKKFMAYEIVKEIRGEEEALRAQEHFERTVQGKELPDAIPDYSLGSTSLGILDALVRAGLTTSTSEGRRLIQGAGIKVNGEVVSDPAIILDLTTPVLLQKGKRGLARVQA